MNLRHITPLCVPSGDAQRGYQSGENSDPKPKKTRLVNEHLTAAIDGHEMQRLHAS